MAAFKTESELVSGSPKNDRFWEAALPIAQRPLAAPSLVD